MFWLFSPFADIIPDLVFALVGETGGWRLTKCEERHRLFSVQRTISSTPLSSIMEFPFHFLLAFSWQRKTNYFKGVAILVSVQNWFGSYLLPFRFIKNLVWPLWRQIQRTIILVPGIAVIFKFCQQPIRPGGGKG